MRQQTARLLRKTFKDRKGYQKKKEEYNKLSWVEKTRVKKELKDEPAYEVICDLPLPDWRKPHKHKIIKKSFKEMKVEDE